ncbi:MAG: hypothetical protein DMG07_14040 [Acidobacteria bacterium]|nr:MAG: hypothetical protein DMG07_14040 [Acidobacteriota bacterium]
MRRPAPDQPQRDAAIAERARNVLVGAGAGTGKTAILVDRLVEMVAPNGGGRAVPISRIAAITFTRKAAGELRLRIRERLLQELAEEQPGSERESQLRDAIAGLDTAYVGTIHSFADRLLRLRPVEAWLSPAYDIAEDDAPLIHEAFEAFFHAVEGGTRAEELGGAEAAGRADEASVTIRDAVAAGLQPESRDTEWYVYYAARRSSPRYAARDARPRRVSRGGGGVRCARGSCRRRFPGGGLDHSDRARPAASARLRRTRAAAARRTRATG